MVSTDPQVLKASFSKELDDDVSVFWLELYRAVRDVKPLQRLVVKLDRRAQDAVKDQKETILNVVAFQVEHFHAARLELQRFHQLCRPVLADEVPTQVDNFQAAAPWDRCKELRELR